MFSILIYETLGPVFSKIAIEKAEEINGLDNIKNQQVNDEEADIDSACYTYIPEGSES